MCGVREGVIREEVSAEVEREMCTIRRGSEASRKRVQTDRQAGRGTETEVHSERGRQTDRQKDKERGKEKGIDRDRCVWREGGGADRDRERESASSK